MSENKYLLTIAIPTYNGGKTIAKMLGLLLPQCDNRVEVLISDNASTDETSEIISGFIKEYPFVKYIRNEHNIGPDSNFLQCMELAQGKYTYLLSDDDILIEDRLKIILEFLENNAEMSLVYLNAVSFHEKYTDFEHCAQYNKAIYDDRNFATTDKKEFMRYAGRLWGFLSCFMCLTEAFKSYKSFDAYKKTHWLQSYIHILCADYGEKRLGVVGVPCVAGGIYNVLISPTVGNINSYKYRNMLNFAVAHGFDKKQLDEWFIWRICFLDRRNIIKFKAAGRKDFDFASTYDCTKKSPYAWLTLYPFMLLPRFLCRWVVALNNRRRNYTQNVHTLREGDVIG